jgi:hypothetical protein
MPPSGPSPLSYGSADKNMNPVIAAELGGSFPHRGNSAIYCAITIVYWQSAGDVGRQNYSQASRMVE